MEDNLQSQSNLVVIQTQPQITQEKSKKWINRALFVFGGLILVGGAFYGGVQYSENKQRQGLMATPTPKKEVPTPSIKSVNREVLEWYSVEYPADFFIFEKDYNTFSVAEKRWEGHIGNIPRAQIEVYTNVISGGMSLREWLSGVGDPNPPIGDSSPKSCKEFFDKLRQKVKYGDLYNDPYLKEGNCMYLGVSNVQDTTVAGLPGIKFNTQYVSAGVTHTAITYKNKAGMILLFDISMRQTGMSDEKDQTIRAYESFLDTFKIREE